MIDKIKNGLYDIYKSYLFKNIEGDHAIKSIIDIYEDSEANLTKHMNTLLVQTTIKLLLNINPESLIVFKSIEGGILDNNITLNTRYYLYHLVEQHFPDKLDNLQDFILRYLPIYFGDNIEFDGVEVIKAKLGEFLFLTHKTLSSYFPRHQFKWNHNFNGFSNGNILILHKDNDPYIKENYSEQYSYDNNNKEMLLGNGIKLLQLGFVLQIFKLITKSFEESGLFFNFSGDPESPIKISYKDCDIFLYIFKKLLIEPIKQPKKKYKFKRTGVIEFNTKGTYQKIIPKDSVARR